VSTDRTDVETDRETAEPVPNQTLILVHGRNARISASILLSHWRTAIERALERDSPGGPDLSRTRVQMLYYGDLLNEVSAVEPTRPAIEQADRELSLKRLLALKNSKQFRRVHYEALPGKNSIREFGADVSAPLSNVLGLGRKRIARVMPELISYWENQQEFRDQVQSRLAKLVSAALARDDRVMVIAHCLGSVIAYDTFWSLSHSDPALSTERRVDTFVTLGSPLADNYVRHHLAGGKASQQGAHGVSYPDLFNKWLNIAAEDDHICHDETVSNDFEEMLKSRLVTSIDDYRIYNLSVNYGRSNPHSAIGYLIHPRLSRILGDWLTEGSDT